MSAIAMTVARPTAGLASVQVATDRRPVASARGCRGGRASTSGSKSSSSSAIQSRNLTQRHFNGGDAAAMLAVRSRAPVTIARRRSVQTNASLFGVGAPEALVIGVVALLVFGPKGLADIAKQLGQTLRAFQPTIKELQEVSREFRDTLEDEIGLDEIRNDIAGVTAPVPTKRQAPVPDPVSADTAVSAPVKAPEPPTTAPPAPTRPTGAVSLEELEARMNAAAPNVHARAKAAAEVVKEAAEAAAAAPEAAAAIVEPETDAKEPEGPTTYASIAAKMRAAAAAKAPNAVSKPKPAAPPKAPAASSADPAPAHKTTHEKLTHDPVTAVFVRNIPQSADEASIEAAFAKIGPIATVTIRTAKRAPDASGDAAAASDKPAGRYAFVQFERAESAQAAIEAVIEMDGRALSVEEKRETSGGHRNQGQGGGGANGRGKLANNNAGRGGNQRDGRQQGTRGPRRDGEGGKNQGQGERRAQGGPRAQGGERRQPARQPAAAKA
mmetsp:Transcript_3552/g.9503  ORF Transcript_3552/g.9503 Transcript_3552/m.9503 type:complete len:497 (+) Transcript_3552:26-1516(+)